MPPGTLTNTVNGQTMTATPNVGTTVAQQTAAQTQGWNPVASASQPATSGFTSSAQAPINMATNQGLANGLAMVNGQGMVATPNANTTLGQIQNAQSMGFNPVNSQSGSQGSQGTPAPKPGDPEYVNYLMGQTIQSGQNAITTEGNLVDTNKQSQIATANSNAALGMQNVNLEYNTALGQLNTQYAQAFQQLQTSHQNSVGSALAMIAQSGGGGSLAGNATGQQYIGKINDLYQQTAGFLTAAAGQQQQALANGEMEAANQIQQQMNTAIQTANTNAVQMNIGLLQAQQQLNQNMVQFGEFEQSRTQQAQSIFNTSLQSGTLPLAAINASGVIKGTDANGSPILDTGALSSGANAIQEFMQTGTWNIPTGMSASQFNALKQLYNDPTFQNGLAAGYAPSAILQQMVQGSNRQTEINLQTQAQTRAWQVAGAQYGITPTGMSGTQSASGQTVFSPGTLGATIISSPGIQTAPTDVINKIATFTSVGSDESMANIDNFVQTGNTNLFTSVIGPLINGFAGTNIGDVTTSADAANMAAETLGVNSSVFANLSNRNPATRGQAAYTVLNAIKGKMDSEVGILSNHYKLKADAGDLDAASSALGNEIQKLGTYVTSNGGTLGGTQNDYFSAVNNSSWTSLFNPSWFSSSNQ